MRAVALALILPCVGCGFLLGTNDPWPIDSGPAEDDAGPDGPPCEMNPVGECCPTTNIGHAASSGATRFRIANLKFMGFKGTGTNVVDTTGPLVPLSLCDYYNPTGKNGGYKVIHISAASRWCGPCSQETSDVSGYNYSNNTRTGPGIAADTAPIGALFVQALIDGTTPTTGATTNDLRIWMGSHQSNFPSLLDPGPTQLNPFTDGKTLPWNADIDARSLEILQVGVGAVPDLEGEVKTWIGWTGSNPPMP